ncbi:MAG: hypothetical protein QOJ99_5747 [Bryobacterales bacterium]|nr:hypothetical protein [Bryobacterales bacterium]
MPLLRRLRDGRATGLHSGKRCRGCGGNRGRNAGGGGPLSQPVLMPEAASRPATLLRARDPGTGYASTEIAAEATRSEFSGTENGRL